MVSYITSMKEFRSQLKKMGENIADSMHAAMLLRNLPESWQLISQMICMIAHTPDDNEERLKAHEADLNALEVSNQAATAFSACARPFCPNSFAQLKHYSPQPNAQDPHSTAIIVANPAIWIYYTLHQRLTEKKPVI